MPPSLISPLVTGTEPVDPSTYVTFFRPWTQALECTRQGHGLLREAASATWLAPGAPGAGRTGARLRLVVGRYAGTAARYAATAARYAA